MYMGYTYKEMYECAMFCVLYVGKMVVCREHVHCDLIKCKTISLFIVWFVCDRRFGLCDILFVVLTFVGFLCVCVLCLSFAPYDLFLRKSLLRLCFFFLSIYIILAFTLESLFAYLRRFVWIFCAHRQRLRWIDRTWKLQRSSKAMYISFELFVRCFRVVFSILNQEKKRRIKYI